jgi:hypothetical protein
MSTATARRPRRTPGADGGGRMTIEYPDGTTVIVDFVIPTRDEALAAIADGATNGRELLEEAGLGRTEAEAAAGGG